MIVTPMPSMAFADEHERYNRGNDCECGHEDENGRESYNTGTITMDAEPGNLAESCVIGIGTATDFCPMSSIPDSYTISVKKMDGVRQLRRKIRMKMNHCTKSPVSKRILAFSQRYPCGGYFS